MNYLWLFCDSVSSSIVSFINTHFLNTVDYVCLFKKSTLLCIAHLTNYRKKEFRGLMHQDMHRALRFNNLLLNKVSPSLQLFIVYLYCLYHIKVGFMPLKGILLSVMMGFFCALTFRFFLHRHISLKLF